MKKNYFHFAINSDREKDIINLKKRLEELNIFNVTNDEIFELLLEKDRRIILSEKDIRSIIGRKRGIL